MKKPWGYHLICDLKDCDVNMNDREHIKTFLKDLLSTIDMKAYGEPMMPHFGQ